MKFIKNNILLICLVIIGFLQFSCDEFDIVKLAERGNAIEGTNEPTKTSTPETTITLTIEPSPTPISSPEPTTNPIPEYLYVCGSILSGEPYSGSEILTVKYDNDGNIKWSYYYDRDYFFEGANAITVDNENYIYFAGTAVLEESPTNKYHVFKLNSDGEEIWDITSDNIGSSVCTVTGIATDPFGYIYITGFIGNDPKKYFISKHDASDGEEIVNEKWPVISSIIKNNLSTDINIYPGLTPNIYITGGYDGRYFTAKYYPDGNEETSEGWPMFHDAGDYSEARSITSDGNGNVYVTGSVQNPDMTFDIFTWKYNPSGTPIWSDGILYHRDNRIIFAEDIAVDMLGNVYITGCIRSFEDPAFNIITIKYDSTGVPVNNGWPNHYDSGENDKAFALATDEDGNIFVVGFSYSESVGENEKAIIGKYKPTGEEEWFKYFDAELIGKFKDIIIAN